MALPQVEISEKHLLSLCFQYPDDIFPQALGDGIGKEHFVDPARAFLWEYLKGRFKNGDAISLEIVGQDLRKEGQLKKYWGNFFELSQIYTFAPSKAHYTSHRDELIHSNARRVALQKANEIRELTQDPNSDPAELEAASRGALEELSRSLTVGSSILGTKESASAFQAHLKALRESKSTPGMKSGIGPFDDMSGGPRPGELWTVQGPTSGGKSIILLNLAGGIAKYGKGVLIFSLEMTVDEVVARILAGTFGADYFALNNPAEINKGQIDSIVEAMAEYLKCRIFIQDDPEMTTDRIIAETEKIAGKEDIDLVVVDYLQLMNGERDRNETESQEIGRNVKRLKQMAKGLKKAVLTASQQNDDGLLFGSRAIGFHSDVVLAIQDEGVLAKKVRNGPRGHHLPLVMDGAAQRFVAPSGNWADK